MSKNVLGIDVAKKKLDVLLMFDGRELKRKFDNAEGISIASGLACFFAYRAQSVPA